MYLDMRLLLQYYLSKKVSGCESSVMPSHYCVVGVGQGLDLVRLIVFNGKHEMCTMLLSTLKYMYR